MTYTDPDVVTLFTDKILEDDQISAIEGLTVRKIVDGKVLATTAAGAKGNQAVIISQPRCGPFSWNCGVYRGQVERYVKIETVAYTAANPSDEDNALALCEKIHRRIQELLFTAEFNGTGWLMHTEVDDKYPSAPMDSIGYHVLMYRVLCTVGLSS
jgi:hypothetical protein